MPLGLALLLMTAAPAPSRSGTAASSDGVPIHYTVEGRGEPALVLVHGWAIHGGWWEEQARAFALRHRVVRLDLAGHGRSGRGRQEWSLAAFAQDVRAVVEALDLRSAVLVGHSMGASVILEAAPRLSGRVAGLVPVDMLHDVEEVTAEDDIAGMVSRLRAGYAQAVEGFARAWLFAPATPPAVAEEVVQAATSLPAEISIPMLEASWRHDPRPLLKKIRVPIVAVNADRIPTRVEHARRYAPQFEVLLVEGVGHYPMREAPSRFNAQLARALARVAAAPPDARR